MILSKNRHFFSYFFYILKKIQNLIKNINYCEKPLPLIHYHLVNKPIELRSKRY